MTKLVNTFEARELKIKFLAYLTEQIREKNPKIFTEFESSDTVCELVMAAKNGNSTRAVFTLADIEITPEMSSKAMFSLGESIKSTLLDCIPSPKDMLEDIRDGYGYQGKSEDQLRTEIDQDRWEWILVLYTLDFYGIISNFLKTIDS